MQIIRIREKRILQLVQGSMERDVLLFTDMEECKPSSTLMKEGLKLERITNNSAVMVGIPYQQIVRMLLYLAIGTRQILHLRSII